MQHDLARIPSRFNIAIGATLLATLLTLTGCATTEKLQLAEPPEVSTATAATLKFRSVDNFSNVIHHHVVRIDGQPLAIMEPSSSTSFQVNAGTHSIQITCHSRIEDNNSLPRNFSVIDGQAKKSVELSIGDERCYKVGFAITNCAVLTEAEPSYCE